MNQIKHVDSSDLRAYDIVGTDWESSTEDGSFLWFMIWGFDPDKN